MNGSQTQQGLKCGCGCFSTVVPKNEFIQVHLKLALAHSVVSSDQPLLKISDGPIGKWHNRGCAFAQLGAEGLDARHVLEPGLRQAREALRPSV
jgi:hypothetical protein